MASKSKDSDLKLSENVSSGFSKDIFEEIVLGFPDIIHSVDESGRIVSTNNKAIELLGYTRDEIIGKDMIELYADEVRDQVRFGFEELKKKYHFPISSDQIKVAINDEFSRWQSPIHSKDKIVFIPPVAGG